MSGYWLLFWALFGMGWVGVLLGLLWGRWLWKPEVTRRP